MIKVLAVLLFSLLPVRHSCLQIDLLLIGDLSQSVHGFEPFISRAFTQFSDQFDLGEESLKIGVITFSDDARVIVPLTSEAAVLKTGLTHIGTAEGGTNMITSFYKAVDEFAEHGRPGFRKLIIVVSDGDVTSPEQTLAISHMLRNSQIQICSVLIKSIDQKDEFMESISSDCYVKSNYESLIVELRKLDICF